MVGLLVLGGVVAFVLYRQARAHDELVASNQEMAIPSVLVVHPELGPAEVHVVLPGTVQAYMETPIYARVDGYLKQWLVDIGGAVKQGQLLAEIETPEMDQQLAQARAAEAQAQADLKLAQSTEERWKALLANRTVSQQEYDEKSSDLDSKRAGLASATANVRRLEELQSYQKVYAPFDGMITARTVDVGNLINAGSGATAKELFRVAQTKILRIYVNIPESLSSTVAAGTKATIEMASAPTQKVVGTLVRTSGAIDPDSLTMLAELNVENPDGKLLPGGYAQVHFDLTAEHPPLLIPANTLIFRAQGAQVGVVDPSSSTVHLVNIKIGRDFGSKLEVLDGLTKDNAVILNPSDSLAEGAQVKVEGASPHAP
jgi:RND family efflux transporter MFP subunit